MDDERKFRILVVEDEVNNIDKLNRILMPQYDVIVAKNGTSAIKKAEKHIPDLILLDIIMPDMSGFEVISILKRIETTSKIPVIFITGLDSSENEERGLLLGAVDYITKPFRDSIVKARVKTHLQIVQYISTIELQCKIDTLTNIPNRRYFNTQMEKEWARTMRHEKPMSLLLMDIDHFKNYNDTYGHPQGDALLKAVALIFKQSLYRPTDFVSRWGGEEFVILLPETDKRGALEVAERVRESVQNTNFPISDTEYTNVTISIGVNTEIPEEDRDIGEFIDIADKTLYNAKHGGRNCVKHASDI